MITARVVDYEGRRKQMSGQYQLLVHRKSAYRTSNNSTVRQVKIHFREDVATVVIKGQIVHGREV